jgi:MioC protein
MAKFDIIVGSVLGASEYVADALSETLAEHDHSAVIHLNPNFPEISKDSVWLVCTSTHGAGDLPDNIQSFAQQISEQNLADISFMLVGLGDSSYDTYCNGARTMEDLLIKSGAKQLCEALHIDVLVNPIPEEIAILWLNDILTKITIPQ